MNIFYTPEQYIFGSYLELHDQEVRHASKVMRYQLGDDITVVDGNGGRYTGKIAQIAKSTITVTIEARETIDPPKPDLTLGMGIIKKRDRLEFAVEKATELGVSKIMLFRAAHTIKQNVRMDRLEMTALSAMKQSLQAHLPKITVEDSLEDLLAGFEDVSVLAAHEQTKQSARILDKHKQKEQLLLLVGPEGGFSSTELDHITRQKNGKLISLGANRLRSETAVVVFLSQFI